MMIASFALGFVIRYFLLMLYSSRPKSIDLWSNLTQQVEIFGARIPPLQVITIIVTIVILIALTAFLKRTRYGLEMRAAAENFTMARMLGVRANRVIMLAFAVSGMLAAAIGLVGAVAGGAIGGWMGVMVMEQYRAYFRFPELHAAFHWPGFLIAVVASVAAAVAGCLLSVRRAARLSPAVAMQPPRPATYRQGPLDRLAPGRTLDQASRMIVRNLERFPVRAALTGLGLASGLALLIGSQFVFGSLDHIVDQAYFQTQRWSDSIAFAEARGERAIAEAARLPGVFAAEPVRVAPIRIKAGGRTELTRLTGLKAGALMHRPLDGGGRQIAFQGRGIVLSAALAAKLGVRAGDR
eukprot:gene23935-23997_t